MRLVLPLLVAAAVFTQQPARDVQLFRTGTAVLSGTVVVDEANGQPVRRAMITVRRSTEPGVLYQATDDRGRFTVSGLPAGNVQVSVAKPGFVMTYYGARQPGSTFGLPIALTEGKTVDITVRLPRGAAIAGTITDENGDPLPSVGVRVQRVSLSALGQRILTPTSGALVPSTDDRGAYRMYGLPAGDYVVTAQPRFLGPGEVRQTTAAEFDWADRQLRVGGAPGSVKPETVPQPSQTITYASVFYPGTVNSGNASVISLASGQARNGIDMRMQFIATARVEGTVMTSDGQPARGIQVMLVPKSDAPNDAERLLILMEVGMVASTVAMSAADGSFSLQGVGPGEYTVLARRTAAAGRGMPIATTSAETSWAMTDVRVDGRDITGLLLRLAPGQSVAGRVVLETRAPPATPPRVAVSLRAATTRGLGVTAPALSIAASGDAFAVAGLIPATYRLIATAPGLTLKSAMLGNRDVADLPFEIKPGEDVANVVVTLTDSPAELSGVLYDGANRPSSDLSIVLFAVERALWFSGSRRVRPAVRPASDGRFAFTGLMGGEYYLAALTDVSPADLANPQFLEQVVPAAVKITIAYGEKKTQDLRVAGK